MDESKDRENFQKQRRNLILFSLAVIFYEVGNLEISGFNIISIKGTFNPSVVNPFLHGILIYFIWRYFVALKAIYAISKTRTAYIKNVENDAYYKARKLLIRKNDIKLKDFIIDYGESNELKSYKFIRSASKKDEATSVTIEGIRLSYIKVQVVTTMFFTTNEFLEYYFPFILAIFALLESFEFHITKPVFYLLDW